MDIQRIKARIILFTFQMIFFLLAFSCVVFSQNRYEFDFSKNWQWHDLFNDNTTQSYRQVPQVQFLSKQYTLDQARILLAGIANLDSVNELRLLYTVAEKDISKEGKFWQSNLEKYLKYFNVQNSFTGVLSAAVYLTEIKNALNKSYKLFDDRGFFLKKLGNIIDKSSISFDYDAATKVMEILEKQTISQEDLDYIDTSRQFIKMLRSDDNKCFTKDELLENINSSKNQSPLFQIYKVINGNSFADLGNVYVNMQNYKNVIKILRLGENNLRYYASNTLSLFFPKEAWVNSEIFFTFGDNNCDTKTENENEVINLAKLGDDYEVIAKYVIRALFFKEKKNIQVDIFPYLYTNEDTLYLKMMTEVYEGGLSNFIAPVLGENRPSELIEKDFKHFKNTVKAISEKKKLIVIDSLFRAGTSGKFLFHTMGTQMSATIDKILGRSFLTSALSLGPVKFFQIYIRAYEADKKQVRAIFRFNNALENKIRNIGAKIPDDIYLDFVKINMRNKNPSPIPNEIEKAVKRYSPEKEYLYMVNLLAGQLLYDKEFYDKSLTYFINAYSGIPNKQLFLKDKIDSYLKVKSYYEALEMCKLFVMLLPKSAEPYFYIGRVYYEKFDLDKAKENFEKVLSIEKNNETARYYLEKINEQLNNQ